MQRVINHTFFKFFLGFLAILIFSFVIIGFVSQIKEGDTNSKTQSACDTGDNC